MSSGSHGTLSGVLCSSKENDRLLDVVGRANVVEGAHLLDDMNEGEGEGEGDVEIFEERSLVVAKKFGITPT
jgi:hypothetical protein